MANHRIPPGLPPSRRPGRRPDPVGFRITEPIPVAAIAHERTRALVRQAELSFGVEVRDRRRERPSLFFGNGLLARVVRTSGPRPARALASDAGVRVRPARRPQLGGPGPQGILLLRRGHGRPPGELSRRPGEAPPGRHASAGWLPPTGQVTLGGIPRSRTGDARESPRSGNPAGAVRRGGPCGPHSGVPGHRRRAAGFGDTRGPQFVLDRAEGRDGRRRPVATGASAVRGPRPTPRGPAADPGR